MLKCKKKNSYLLQHYLKEFYFSHLFLQKFATDFCDIELI